MDAAVSPGAGARAVDLLERLVAIPSVTGAEDEVLAFLERRFSEGGWTVEAMEVAPRRRNLFVRRGHPSVVLTTHADTVPPFFPPRREGGVLVGRGACDAKASLAAAAPSPGGRGVPGARFEVTLPACHRRFTGLERS